MVHWAGVFVISALHFSWSGNATLVSISFALQRSGVVDILLLALISLLLYKSLASTSSLLRLDANTLYT